MNTIVISETMDDGAVQTLRAHCTVVYDPALVDDAPRLHAAAADADALIVRNRTQVRGALLDAMARVRVIGRLGVGLDNIDMPACRARGLRVIPATGANAAAVAEYVLGSAMVLLRGAYHSSAAVAAGQWPRPLLSNGREIAGKTLGLVGFGSIGQVTARLAQAVGMRVMAYDPAIAADAPLWQTSGVVRCDLDVLLAQSDVVSLHLPLIDATKNLRVLGERVDASPCASTRLDSAYPETASCAGERRSARRLRHPKKNRTRATFPILRAGSEMNVTCEFVSCDLCLS